MVVRFGILSAAGIARVVVPAIHAARNATVTAIAAREPDRARDFAVAHEIAKVHDTYDALLDDDAIDAVYIPLPNSLHREWSIAAMERGKHVLCEKPLGLTEAECLEMVKAADEHGVVLMEAFMYRFHPRMARVLAMLGEGIIGDVRAIRSNFTFRLLRPDNIRLRPDLGGGALMDVGCYCVNVSRTIVGAEPVAVHAIARWADSGVDEQLGGMLRFGNGALATFDCALTLERRETVEVAGTEGSIVLPSAFLPGTADAPIIHTRGRHGEEVHVVPGADQYRLMVEHFADVVAGAATLRYSAVEAAANMRVIEALYGAAAGGGGSVRLTGAL